MSDEKQKKIFSKNLSFYLEKSGKSQKEVAKAIGVIPQTFNTWCTGQSIPRMGSVQALADYFGIGKSDLIEEKSDQAIELTKKDEKDIAKRLEQTLDQLESDQDGLMFSGESLDDETRELLKASLQNSITIAKINAKQKFTPKKYRK